MTILLKSAWAPELTPSLRALTSVKTMDVSPYYAAPALSNLPVQSHNINMPTTEEFLIDPSKLSLTNPRRGCHLTKWLDVVGGEENPQSIHQPTYEFGFLIRYMPFLV